VGRRWLTASIRSRLARDRSRARKLSGLGDACLDQLADEGRGQRLVKTEMKGALGLAVAFEISRESLQRQFH
jgi:hypothetical protein